MRLKSRKVPWKSLRPRRRLVFPTFQITSSPTIPLSEIKKRRFKIIENNSIQEAEDARIKSTIKTPKCK